MRLFGYDDFATEYSLFVECTVLSRGACEPEMIVNCIRFTLREGFPEKVGGCAG